MGAVVAECMALAQMKPTPADRTIPSNLPAHIMRDLKERPVPPGARRVYNKAFKMPERPKRDAVR